MVPKSRAVRKYGITKTKQTADVVLALIMLVAPGVLQAAVIFSNSHNYGSLITIDVTVEDNYLGDPSKYWWKYDVTNLTYDPTAGASNGFSGFQITLPPSFDGIADRAAPNARWSFDCCSGQPVEYDIRNSAGLGIMPGESGLFSFTSPPLSITNSTGWFHSWENDVQTDIRDFSSFQGAAGPEIPAIPEPETFAMLLAGLGLLGCIRYFRKYEKNGIAYY